MNELNLKIPSISDNIRIVESFIDNAKDKFNINDDLYGNIMIAVTESVNNAIAHGNNNDAKKSVDLKLTLSEKDLKVTVKDEGNGFDFDNVPDPTSPENLEKENGRGVFLINNLCDTVNFEDKGSKVELVFNID
ncbi:ATP-binding protein [Cyclobacteriaceae bacterium]|nr:ATP-binding protein [Cyclobacteriaceae bacterium]